MENAKFYKNEKKGTFYQVDEDFDLGNFYFEDYVSQGMYYNNGEHSNDNFDWIDELSAEDQQRIFDLWAQDIVKEAKEEYMEDNEEPIEDVFELVDDYLPSFKEMISEFSFSEFSNLANKFNSVLGFTVTGYSQGESAIVILPEAITGGVMGNREGLEEDIQACFYGGYLSISEVSQDLTESDTLESVSADKYSLEYSDSLDEYMLNNYGATPTSLETTFTIL